MKSSADVFLVQHVHAHDDGEEEVKVIGVYSSRASAEAAVDRLKSKPGFCSHPDGFFIDQYTLDEDNWADGYKPLLPTTVAEAGSEDDS